PHLHSSPLFNHSSTPALYSLSLHDALPISVSRFASSRTSLYCASIIAGSRPLCLRLRQLNNSRFRHSMPRPGMTKDPHRGSQQCTSERHTQSPLGVVRFLNAFAKTRTVDPSPSMSVTFWAMARQ